MLHVYRRGALVSTLLVVGNSKSTNYEFTRCDSGKSNHHNVIFFGYSGVGKTFVCNKLTGQKHPTSSINGTSALELKQYDPILIKGKSVRLIDTCGMYGTVDTPVDAQTALARLNDLSDKYSKEGVSLLVFVRRDGATNVFEEAMVRKMRSLFPGIEVRLINNFMNKNEQLSEEKLKAASFFKSIDIRNQISFSNDDSKYAYDNTSRVKDFLVTGLKPNKVYTKEEMEFNMCNVYVDVLSETMALCNLLITDPIAFASCNVGLAILRGLVSFYCKRRSVKKD